MSELSDSLLADLEQFQHLKKTRWEQVEDSIQMSNRLGTPSEDWIIPPDEDAVLKVLNDDPDYLHLRQNILTKTPQVIAELSKTGYNTHHELDWLKFTDPLLGQAALEDAIDCLKRLKKV